jgi:FAD-dependent oxidoreductase domain-containing protein 1
MGINHFDVVIVGGGVMGSSVAYWLAVNPNFRGSIAVIEKDPTYEFSTTARSSSCIRMQFSTAVNVQISRFGIHFIKNVGDYLATHDQVPDLSFREFGYLFLATTAEGREVLLRNHALQRENGVRDVAILDAGQLHARFPWMNVSEVTCATLGLRNEGGFDPYSLLQAFKRKARSLGVVYLHDQVIGMTRVGSTITEVLTKSAGCIACGTVVNTAGAWAREVAAFAGIDIPVFPRPRFVFAFTCPTAISNMPLLIDPEGFYIRPDRGQFFCGIKPPADQDRNSHDFEVDYSWFDQKLWPRLAHWVPAFESVRMQRAWTGHYEYNTFDQNALLGPHPQVENLFFCNGFSGHGMQQSPAAGRAISELIIHGCYRSLDLSTFSVGRLAQNRRIVEEYVV